MARLRGWPLILAALIIGLVGPTILGFQIDRAIGSTPIMTVFMTLVATNVATMSVIRIMMKRYELIAPSDAGEEDQ